MNVINQVSNPLVVVALLLGTILLAVAAFPKAAVPDGRLIYLLASHRAEVALAGAGALAAVIIALTLA
ncbi:MAG: hypothetical protein ABR569_02165 [Gaiellaceae bacterium]